MSNQIFSQKNFGQNFSLLAIFIKFQLSPTPTVYSSLISGLNPISFNHSIQGYHFRGGAVWRLGRKTLHLESCPKIFCYPYYRCCSPQSNFLIHWKHFGVSRCEINQQGAKKLKLYATIHTYPVLTSSNTSLVGGQCYWSIKLINDGMSLVEIYCASQKTNV